MKPYIFGLCAPKGAGKSTFATALIEAFKAAYAITPVITSFAEPLKSALCALFPGCETGFYDPAMKETALPLPFSRGLPHDRRTYRHVMQRFGEWMRDAWYHDLWVDNMRQRAQLLSQGTCIIIIDDVRYDNEAAFVREQGLVVHVCRSGYEWSKEAPSEMGITPNPADILVQINNCPDRARKLLFDLMNTDHKLAEVVYGE